MAFFIPKDSKISLWPKADDPFEYYRITLDALDNRNFFEQIGFNKAHPVIYFSDGVLERVEELYETVKSATVASTYKGISLLYEICSLLAEQTTVQEKEKDENEYIAKAVAYINAKYYDDINVNKMADTLNINRSYFSTLFKKHMGVSPLAYLTEFRISQACKLLAMDKNITEVAILTGFNTPANFSVSFKRIMKMAPLDYKKYLKSKGEK